ncbi:MAG: transposase [Granulosicoccus sp.]|jgi:transposase
MGHDAKLPHARFVRPFVQNNKTDAADAKAIWTAADQPEMRTVSVKTEEQQAILALHLIRSNLVKTRTAQINQIRGLLYEYGITLRGGRQAGLKQIRDRMAELEDVVPLILFGALIEQLQRIELLDKDVGDVENRMNSWFKQDKACRAITDIPGVGLLTATALVATLANASTFKSGREFAAYIGLCPGKRAPAAS